MRYKSIAAAFLTSSFITAPALAGVGDPIEIAEDTTLDPIINVLARYESVDQDNVVGDADALTVRVRAGAEFAHKGFSFLAESEATLAILTDYNDTIPGNGVEPFSVVADPDNVELNRLQVAYKGDGFGVTVGRQRIILDDARFVGNVGWRQNEQTFDAVRGTAKIGPVSLDATYAQSQRTIFGTESPNEFFDGDMFLLQAGVKAGPVQVNGFAHLIDYDTRLAFSSQTYGALAKASIPLGSVKIALNATYAKQSDYGANPVSYDADYISASVGTSIAGFGVTAGYEELGSDGGVAAFQTPLATAHKFNGWADLFLSTPAAGLRDYYAKATYKFTGIKLLPGLNTSLTYHQFDSDFGGIDYGSEWDATLGFKIGKVGILAKYANYKADGFGVDTEKFWLQAGIAF